ncbi:MAG: MFS transporter [Dehalococcoidia bacterium]|nr:MFS transporter [Dehalococcoidia bacterium]
MKYLSRISAVPLPIRLAAISFLFSLSVQSSSIFLSLYADDLGASKSLVGLIGSAYGIAYFVSSFIFGRQSDRRGRLIFVRVGLVLGAGAYLLQIAAIDPVTLLAIRAFVGFCLGISSAAVMAYVYEAEGQVGRFAAYGSLGWLFGCVAAAVAAAFTGASESHATYYSLFSVSGAASALAFLLSFSLREKEGKGLRVPLFPISLLRSNGRVYVPFFLRCLGSSAVWAVFPLFLVHIGASKLWVAILDAINMGLQFVFMRYVERFGSTLVLAVGLFTSVIVFASYGVATHYLQLIPVEALLAVSWSCLWVGSLSFLMSRSVERGTAAGLLYSMTYLSAGFGPLIGGFVSDTWGFKALMFVAAGLTFLGLMLSRVLPGGGQPARQG